MVPALIFVAVWVPVWLLIFDKVFGRMFRGGYDGEGTGIDAPGSGWGGSRQPNTDQQDAANLRTRARSGAANTAVRFTPWES